MKNKKAYRQSILAKKKDKSAKHKQHKRKPKVYQHMLSSEDIKGTFKHFNQRPTHNAMSEKNKKSD